MFYTLLPLEKFNNEMYSSMPAIGEIDAGGENEREKERERKRRRKRVENEKNLTFV
jgi:hypothetical protein